MQHNGKAVEAATRLSESPHVSAELRERQLSKRPNESSAAGRETLVWCTEQFLRSNYVDRLRKALRQSAATTSTQGDTRQVVMARVYS